MAIARASASYPDGQGRVVDRPAGADAAVREIRATFDFCRGSDAGEVARYVQWLEAAAAAGDPRAQLAYGADYPGDDELDSNNESDAAVLRARQARYVEHLEQAKQSGSIDAMSKLASHYYALYTDVSNPSPTSLKQAVAHLYPYAWYRWRYEGSDRSLRYLKSMGDRLTPLELAEAIAEGKRFVESEECCFKVPGN